MASLPITKTGNPAIDVWITKVKSQLDPILANQLVQGRLVTQALQPGVNNINHLLGRQQVGWMQSDLSGPAVVWRSAPLNSSTLTLTCSAVAQVTVSFWVF